MATPKILVAGIGNIFLGDDGFGVQVVQQLANCELPENVCVADFGIRGFDLVYALLDGYDLSIFVDATARGGPPGTLYIIEAELDQLEALDSETVTVETHGMDPLRVLAMVKAMGGKIERLIVVGCEPVPMDAYDEGQMGLSEPVTAAVDEAVRMVEKLIQESMTESESGMDFSQEKRKDSRL